MGSAPTDAFAAWVEPHLPALWLLARRCCGQDAADVVQEALLKACTTRETYDEDRGFLRTWLLVLVADRCRKHLRRARTESPLVEVAAASRDHDVDLDLRRAVARLAHRQRLAVELHYVLDLPVADVATVMGCSTGTVKSTLFDARARLRVMLEVTG
ncbi:MAG: sigma-70 family RNA polymerase sigma factor [Mycobacteriales bacterium]|nr:sigma-70 family RNA polymerase sigma factor [Mycobacteriales bacterium]